MDKTKLREHFRKATTTPEGWSGDLFFKNERGQSLRYGHAPALTPEPRGTIIHRHGHGESIDLYNEAISWYQKQGFDVWAYDLAGQGLSEGKDPNKDPSPKDTLHDVNDLDQFARRIVKRTPNKPLILSAHSLSGHSGLIYLKRHPDVFSGAVMSSPMFDIYRLGLPACFRPVVRGIFALAAMVGLKNVETPVAGYNNFIDRVQKTSEQLAHISLGEINYRGEVKRVLKELHPERYRDRPTFGWVGAAFKTIIPTLRRSFLKDIQTPLLIGSAGPLEDLVANDAHERVARIIPHAELKKMPFAVHSLWHDRDSNFKIWQGYVATFLDKIAPDNAPQYCSLQARNSASSPCAHRHHALTQA